MKKLIILLSLILATAFPIYAHADKTTTLSAIGTLSASDVYVKYIAIGALGDAYNGGVYKEALLQQTAIQLSNLCDVTKESFVQMKQNGTLTGEDVRYAIKMIETYGYLKSQSDALLQYSKTSDVKDANNYETYRKLAWENIKQLLNL